MDLNETFHSGGKNMCLDVNQWIFKQKVNNSLNFKRGPNMEYCFDKLNTYDNSLVLHAYILKVKKWGGGYVNGNLW